MAIPSAGTAAADGRAQRTSIHLILQLKQVMDKNDQKIAGRRLGLEQALDCRCVYYARGWEAAKVCRPPALVRAATVPRGRRAVSGCAGE